MSHVAHRSSVPARYTSLAADRRWVMGQLSTPIHGDLARLPSPASALLFTSGCLAASGVALPVYGVATARTATDNTRRSSNCSAVGDGLRLVQVLSVEHMADQLYRNAPRCAWPGAGHCFRRSCIRWLRCCSVLSRGPRQAALTRLSDSPMARAPATEWGESADWIFLQRTAAYAGTSQPATLTARSGRCQLRAPDVDGRRACYAPHNSSMK
jgi:hypothetical protein